MKMIFVRMGKGEKMRLIDADNLKIPSDAPYKASVKRVVAQQPTVEAKEVVHGKWIDTQPDYHNGFYRNAHVCSNCNDYYTTEYDDLFFCPRCGADMRTSAE